MTRMSNMAMKPVSWVKKHWVKVVVAIVVIYAIYWLFIQEDVEGYTTVNVLNTYEIQQLKNKYEDAKATYESSLRAYNDPLAATYVDHDGNSPTSTCSKTVPITSNGSDWKYDNVIGCGGHLAAKKALMETALKAYEPYAPKQKRSKKARRASRVRRFFGLA